MHETTTVSRLIYKKTKSSKWKDAIGIVDMSTDLDIIIDLETRKAVGTIYDYRPMSLGCVVSGDELQFETHKDINAK